MADDINLKNEFQIGLMRHPPVDVISGLCYGHTDIALKTGWEKYASLPDDLIVDYIYSSPLSRCLKLTQAIANRYQIAFQTDIRLMEFNFGQWEGKIWDDIPKELIDHWAKNPWDWQIPEGETGRLLLNRVSEIWCELKNKKQNILIISHGGPLRLLRQIALNQSVELLGPLPDFGQLEYFTFDK